MAALRPILSQLQTVNQMLIKRLQPSTKGQHEFFNQVGSLMSKRIWADESLILIIWIYLMGLFI